jgi:hypothetical protein|tara:strand:- start:178 stop:1299 length:1122 start_codon:yes stop_codon:yes gene_type:complete
VLTKADEYPFHQIPGTFSTIQTTDKHWNDGHYVCLCDDKGEVSLISVIRLYQNNDVLDGFVCIRHEGKQHNIRISRRLRVDMDFFGVGPLRMDILEPMQLVRLVLDENEHDISCDIQCHSSRVPYEDPIDRSWVEDRLMSERVVYEVVGHCEGHITVAGKKIALTKEHSTFFRNHSWGTMPGRGGPREHGAPPLKPKPMAGLRLWVLYEMPDHGGFFHFHENKIGERQHTRAVTLNQDSHEEILSVKHSLTFYEGTTRIKGGSFVTREEDGPERLYEIEDMGWIYCQGGGYFGGFDDGLGQGAWRGEYHMEGEVWDASHPVKIVTPDGEEKILWNAWAESFVKLTCDGQVGFAHLECVTLGKFEPYNLVADGG